MRDFDDGEANARGDEQRALSQHDARSASQQHRLHIYRVALTRLRGECAGGMPASRATWQVAYAIYEGFGLDTRQFALLVRCLIAAAAEG